MRKAISALLFTFFYFAAFAQNMTVDELIDKGIQQHDKGEYAVAITYFKQALSADDKSPRANYEMANTCIAIEKYKDAIKYTDKVIEAGNKYEDQAYTLKGTALDLLGKPNEALATYHEALKKYPENVLLNYNVALTYFNMKKYDEAATHATKALQNNIDHTSSHILLGYAMYYKGKRAQSLLSLYYFLFLECDTKRSGDARELISLQLKSGVTKQEETKINVIIPMNKDKDDFFGPAEMMLSMLQAASVTGKDKEKNEREQFFDRTSTFLRVLTKLADDKESKPGDIWTGTYIPFYKKLSDAGHMDAFCAYIIPTSTDKSVETWINNNKSKLEDMNKWYENLPH